MLVAFETGSTLDPAPTWTRLDNHPNLITSYTIDRGRQYEFDQTDTGRATVEIADQDGILDPTNSTGDYYGLIEPLLQVALQRYNPIDDTWYTRFRGWTEDYDYDFDPSQRVNRLSLSLVDIFEILSAVEMQPGEFGIDPVAAGWKADPASPVVLFGEQRPHDRMHQIIEQSHVPVEFAVLFTGNVLLWETVYSPGETAMSAIQDAADAEMPTVSNVACDRFGRLAFHGRLSKFDPAGVLAGDGVPDQWEYVEWEVGDLAAVLAEPEPPMARLHQFAFNRGLAKIVNQATAAPMWVLESPTTARPPNNSERAAQVVTNATSVGRFSLRSWSADNLLTKQGFLDGSTALEETHRFAQFMVDNYAEPRNRVTRLGFRTARPGAAGAGEVWDLLSRVDISHALNVTIGSPGGGGFQREPFFVEGVHEEVRPLNPVYDDITLTVDLSPRAYFDNHTMFPDEA